MTNREKYFLKRDEYDLMMAISENAYHCPIYLVSGKFLHKMCQTTEELCGKCVQKWLNEESEK